MINKLLLFCKMFQNKSMNLIFFNLETRQVEFEIESNAIRIFVEVH